MMAIMIRNPYTSDDGKKFVRRFYNDNFVRLKLS